jgi:chloride channel protein, CIC family
MDPVSKDVLRDFTTDSRVLILSAIAIGIGMLGTGAAYVLQWLIGLITHVAYYGTFATHMVSPAGAHLHLWSVLIPVAGGLVVGFMARYGSEKIRGHGIPEAIEAILIGGSRIEPKVAVLKPVSSAIAIGTGGPFGAEGPIIMTGGALGSLIGQMLNLSAAERKTLLVAGAAAGMSATFGTPVAAVLLAIELLLFEWKPRSFIPVATAATVAAVLRPLLIGTAPLFPMALHNTQGWPELLICLFIGLLEGCGSGILTTLVYAFEDLFRHLPIHWMWWPAIGGLAVGLGGLIAPRSLGVGYDIIADLLNNQLTIGVILALVIVKALIWSIALGSGTSGGVLAPLLIMGGALGAVAGHFIPIGDPGYWAMIGMAAIMGGTMRSPLTGIVFLIELTHNFGALLPLLIASTTAYAVTVLLLRRSILTEKLARRGQHITREYVVDPFEITRIGDVMVRSVDTLPGNMRVEDAVSFFTSEPAAGERRHKSYPVIGDGQRLVGLVTRADALRWLMQGWTPGTTLASVLAGSEPLVGHPDQLVGELADRMAADNIGRVPVVERGSLRLVGIVARKDLLHVRARMVREERERQPVLRVRQGRS